jgi:hypothetical protein
VGKQNTIELYREKLGWHDWTYEYSDDHRVWQKGTQQRDELKGIELELLALGTTMKEIKTIWNEYAPEMFRYEI